MAAATVNRRVDTFASNRRILAAQLTLAATADTWATGLRKVDNVQLTSRTANVPGLYFTVAESTGIITFTYTGGGAATLDVLVFGG